MATLSSFSSALAHALSPVLESQIWSVYYIDEGLTDHVVTVHGLRGFVVDPVHATSTN